MDTQSRNILLDHMPEAGLEYVASWLDRYPVALAITRRRHSKMGDYRPPQKVKHHRISVNGDLHPMAFLVTLIHEIAHMVIWDNYRRKVQPHGEQWKEQFRRMLGEVYLTGAFDEETARIVHDFSAGKISYRAFNIKFEKKIHEQSPDNGEQMLGDLPVNTLFSLPNGRTFMKREKLRTRYRCKEVRSGKYYLISSLAKVKQIPDKR